MTRDEEKFCESLVTQLDHQICMGIRHGLFGKSAGWDESINDELSAIAAAINNLAEAIREKK